MLCRMLKGKWVLCVHLPHFSLGALYMCVRVCCYSFFFCWIHLLYFGDLHLTIDGRSPDTWNFHTFHSILCAQRFSRLLLLFRFVIHCRSLFVTIFLFECRQFLHISKTSSCVAQTWILLLLFFLQAFHCFLWLCSGLIPPFLQYSLKLLVTSVVCYFRLFATLVFLSKFYVRFQTSPFQCPKFFSKYLRLNERKKWFEISNVRWKTCKIHWLYMPDVRLPEGLPMNCTHMYFMHTAKFTEFAQQENIFRYYNSYEILQQQKQRQQRENIWQQNLT